MKKRYYPKRAYALIFITLLFVTVIISPVMAEDSEGQKIKLSCKYPGRIIEAGETVTFDLTIQNIGAPEYSQDFYVDTYKGESDWEFNFYAGDKEIDRLSIPRGDSDTIQLDVKTTGDTPIGTYPLRVRVYDGKIWLYITVDKTHEGENGILKMQVVDEQGECIKGARVSAFEGKDTDATGMVSSMSDGQIRTELPQGTYRLVVEKDGYLQREIDDVVIQSGYTEDLGTILLERKNYGLDIDVKAPVITSSIGENPVYEMTLMNVGKSDDVFSLSSKDMPEGWYATYRENTDSNSEVSEVFINAGEEKDLYLEAIMPYSVTKGEYMFESVISSSDGMEYETDLKATIRGSADLQVFSEKYLYEISKGDQVDIPVKITNNGNGVALTNIRINATVPDGWTVTATPATISSIEPGESSTVILNVIPPSDIAASEYKLTVNVVSDQEEVSDSIRLAVKENSLVGLLGIIMILLVGAGVYYMYRKYERR
ncbi:Alpha-galactosidase, NPCBM associated NEW3 domain protein [Methanolacinia petrolearia DSM 11571]|uniref:Alpha-galactosidase, NPCBM associated NEW3 domain protein n=1 Tax=Methanolacinia petrolearia (strain DSM 11571 / OCM 486 / SEBR 4847) TaxID=679926 RepID=E1RJB5_METP4|nr:NEW3 domain-containing protein [Methanolacinia petrolearia]ADN35633.1 Alpha-galactosidase, NPCBM associated NEW3 domain protein [Methanolacinia petrolearia DSM 11571]